MSLFKEREFRWQVGEGTLQKVRVAQPVPSVRRPHLSGPGLPLKLKREADGLAETKGEVKYSQGIIT